MKFKLLFISAILISGISKAQSLRNVKGSKGIDVTGHYAKFGKAFSLGYSENVEDKVSIKARLNYETGLITHTNYNVISIIPSATYTLINLKSILFIDGEIGGFGALEKAKNIDFAIDETTGIYGVVAGGEAKVFIKNVALLFNFYEFYTLKSKFGTYRYQAGVGARFYF
jgi:hypothetical protein